MIEPMDLICFEAYLATVSEPRKSDPSGLLKSFVTICRELAKDYNLDLA